MDRRSYDIRVNRAEAFQSLAAVVSGLDVASIRDRILGACLRFPDFSNIIGLERTTERESSVPVLTQEALREEPGLTELAFTRLLEWLDDGVDTHGESYLEMRQRLVSYFDRRNRPSADELADEAFNRIGRTLEKSGVIETTPPARYCYVVARFVLLEDLRRERRHVPFDEWRGVDESGGRIKLVEADADLAIKERRLECLDHCLERLRPERRELVVDYYRDSLRLKIERRRDLAKRLGITMNALGIRASRIRSALMTCVQACHK